MKPTMLAIPQTAVAAAGRALQFTIAELSARLRNLGNDEPAHGMVAEEMFLMQDAVKALYSALPIPEDKPNPPT